jgi:hypothetical protein
VEQGGRNVDNKDLLIGKQEGQMRHKKDWTGIAGFEDGAISQGRQIGLS